VLLFALGSAFILDMLDPTLRRTEQIENLYGAPLLVALTGTEQALPTSFAHRLTSPSKNER
jgi:capsular polysaccharide biosynthesis protein